MSESMNSIELYRMLERVFRPTTADRRLAILVDLPDSVLPDHDSWCARRKMAVDWWQALREGRAESGLERIDLIYYRNAHRNNAEFPSGAFVFDGGEHPADAGAIAGRERDLDALLAGYTILIAINELSATAPLKLRARRHGFRAASMPGFNAAMIPALRLDYVQIDRRCRQLKRLLDPATAAEIQFRVADRSYDLTLDLRHRTATASGGLLVDPGVAGNLPSGETYIVPYEGEIEGDPSRTRGSMPLEIDGELLEYRIRHNRVYEVEGGGPAARAEREEVEREPAYCNIAELGLGVLGAYGVEPVGELLLDEKLGLHIALGRSDHFGGQVGPSDFSSPDRVIHLDRVYIPQVQPQIHVVSVDLLTAHGSDGRLPLMRDGAYLPERFED